MKSQGSRLLLAQNQRARHRKLNCFRIFIKSRSQSSSDSRNANTVRNRREELYGLYVHQKCMGFPWPIPQPEKGLFPSCARTTTWGCKVRTKSQIRRRSRARTHVQPTREHFLPLSLHLSLYYAHRPFVYNLYTYHRPQTFPLERSLS